MLFQTFGASLLKNIFAGTSVVRASDQVVFAGDAAIKVVKSVTKAARDL